MHMQNCIVSGGARQWGGISLPQSPVFDKLLELARPLYASRCDASHDIGHAERVARLAGLIASKEGGDMDVVIASAIFHDVVIYPKNDPRSGEAPGESALVAARVLKQVGEPFSDEKIEKVCRIIRLCSDTVEGAPCDLEGVIVKDADLLEKTGAIAIARTFWSAGNMGAPLDGPEGSVSAMEYLRTKLRNIQARLQTGTAKDLSVERAAFLDAFICQIEREM